MNIIDWHSNSSVHQIQGVKSFQLFSGDWLLRPRTGLSTIAMILTIIVALSGGIVVAGISGSNLGWIGYVGGFVVGLFGALLVFGALIYSIIISVGIIVGFSYPVCSNGSCRDGASPNNNYSFEMIEGKLVAHCRCGDLYVKKGRRVFRLETDGSLTPYMIWKPFLGWFVM